MKQLANGNQQMAISKWQLAIGSWPNRIENETP
jgi:hypothetical protein